MRIISVKETNAHFFPEGGVGQTQAWMPAFMLTYLKIPQMM
jgi:hypothetical protein